MFWCVRTYVRSAKVRKENLLCRLVRSYEYMWQQQQQRMMMMMMMMGDDETTMMGVDDDGWMGGMRSGGCEKKTRSVLNANNARWTT